MKRKRRGLRPFLILVVVLLLLKGFCIAVAFPRRDADIEAGDNRILVDIQQTSGNRYLVPTLQFLTFTFVVRSEAKLNSPKTDIASFKREAPVTEKTSSVQSQDPEEQEEEEYEKAPHPIHQLNNVCTFFVRDRYSNQLLDKVGT